MATPHDAPVTPNPADKANELYHDYLAGGPDAAYKSLKADYDATAGMQNRDEYWKNVGADLQASGHMPNLAVGWLKAEKGNLDKNGDGVIDFGEVKDARAEGGLNAMFSEQVTAKIPSPGDNKTFYDQIAHTKRAWSDSPDGIEDADLRKYSRQMHRAERRAYNQDEVAQAAAPLLDNNAELARFLDARKDGSEGNGFISRHEMKRFLKDYKEHPGEGIYTPQNAEYVNELLHGEIARVHNPPFHGFSIDHLARRAGLNQRDLEEQPAQVMPPKAELSDAGKKAEAVAAVKDQVCDEKPKQDEISAPKESPLISEQMRQHIDRVSRVQPNEGYNAVAARLLNIFPGHPRTPEEVKDIQTLGHQIQKMNGDISTLRLRTGIVLPVSANIELLMDENPKLKAVLQSQRDNFNY
jgi:hypothetical protein